MEEGGVRELTPPILDASDLDAPPDLLTFRVDRPPRHGRLIYAPGGEGGPESLQRSLQVSSFTLQDLRQGERGQGGSERGGVRVGGVRVQILESYPLRTKVPQNED